MKKTHFLDTTDFNHTIGLPFCVSNVTMKGFLSTTDVTAVTCRLCLMRLGKIPDTRGNWGNRRK